MKTPQATPELEQIKLFTQLLKAEAELQKRMLEAIDSLKIQKIKKSFYEKD